MHPHIHVSIRRPGPPIGVAIAMLVEVRLPVVGFDVAQLPR